MKTVKIVLVSSKTPEEYRARRMANSVHTGKLMSDPKVGRNVFVVDDASESGGLMTSTVQDVETTASGWTVVTRNSVYDIKVLSDSERVLQ